MTMEAPASGIDSLLEEALLNIFRFLNVDDLLIAEQVCLRWKALVSTCIATAKVLTLREENDGNLKNKKGRKAKQDVLKKMKRYGPSVKSLELHMRDVETKDSIDWIAEIGNAFPNLISISLAGVAGRIQSLKVFPIKCSHITKIKLSGCHFTDKQMAILLKGFPGLKRLELHYMHYTCDLGECFRELGTSLEHFSSGYMQITSTGTSYIFSRCINLKCLVFTPLFQFDIDKFTRFCKKAPLRSLTIIWNPLPNDGYLAISYLTFLEELELVSCDNVDSEVLIRIILGCPNLKSVILTSLPLLCDRGLKALAQCRHLTGLSCSCPKMSDESLIEIANSGLLKALDISNCVITDRGVSAILAQCPHLEGLGVSQCSGVGDGTVDAAIAAVESRRSAALDNKSPRDKCNEEADMSRCLLKLYMSGVRLDRYKDDFSHPLLSLKTAKLK